MSLVGRIVSELKSKILRNKFPTLSFSIFPTKTFRPNVKNVPLYHHPKSIFYQIFWIRQYKILNSKVVKTSFLCAIVWLGSTVIPNRMQTKINNALMNKNVKKLNMKDSHSNNMFESTVCKISLLKLNIEMVPFLKTQKSRYLLTDTI